MNRMALVRVMDKNPVIMSDHSFLGAVAKILGEKNCGAVLLTEPTGELSGIFTEKDLSYALTRRISHVEAMISIMTKNPVRVSTGTSLKECADIMMKGGFRHLPVLDGEKIVGLVDVLTCQRVLADSFEQNLIALEQAHKKLDRRDEYLGIVAHDVRSPLAVIQICAEMLEMLQQNSSLGYEPEELIERIKFNVNVALNLVEDILDLGRLDKGAKLNIKSVELHGLLKTIVENLRFSAKEKDVKIEFDSDQGVAADIDGDRFTEILTNLIQNAIKFSPMSGVINIRVRKKQKNRIDYILFEITDQGPGIPKEKLEQIFGRYEQIDSEHKKLGFGLGLSIAKQFTRLHHGEIRVESEVGKGSTFTVKIPQKFKRKI